MKKILLTCTIILTAAGIGFSAEEISYSDTYIHKLDVCEPYTENYEAEIPTNDPNTPVLHLLTKESVVSLKDGKCATKSSVYSKDMNKDILIINCSFPEDERKSLVSKMKAAKTDSTSKEQLQQTITNYVQNRPDVCQVTNLLKD